MNKTSLLAAVGIIAVGSILVIALSSGKITPVVNVSDQEIRDGKVVVANATAVAPSWLVIQTETNGAPGPVIGYVKIGRGENKDVAVSIDVQKSTPKLFAMIHEDNGEKDKFDFPGNDMPLTVNNQMVSQLFTIK
jgi:hypothetical protein